MEISKTTLERLAHIFPQKSQEAQSVSSSTQVLDTPSFINPFTDSSELDFYVCRNQAFLNYQAQEQFLEVLSKLNDLKTEMKSALMNLYLTVLSHEKKFSDFDAERFEDSFLRMAKGIGKRDNCSDLKTNLALFAIKTNIERNLELNDLLDTLKILFDRDYAKCHWKAINSSYPLLCSRKITSRENALEYLNLFLAKAHPQNVKKGKLSDAVDKTNLLLNNLELNSSSILKAVLRITLKQKGFLDLFVNQLVKRNPDALDIFISNYIKLMDLVKWGNCGKVSEKFFQAFNSVKDTKSPDEIVKTLEDFNSNVEKITAAGFYSDNEINGLIELDYNSNPDFANYNGFLKELTKKLVITQGRLPSEQCSLQYPLKKEIETFLSKKPDQNETDRLLPQLIYCQNRAGQFLNTYNFYREQNLTEDEKHKCDELFQACMDGKHDLNHAYYLALAVHHFKLKGLSIEYVKDEILNNNTKNGFKGALILLFKKFHREPDSKESKLFSHILNHCKSLDEKSVDVIAAYQDLIYPTVELEEEEFKLVEELVHYATDTCNVNHGQLASLITTLKSIRPNHVTSEKPFNLALLRPVFDLIKENNISSGSSFVASIQNLQSNLTVSKNKTDGIDGYMSLSKEFLAMGSLALPKIGLRELLDRNVPADLKTLYTQTIFKAQQVNCSNDVFKEHFDKITQESENHLLLVDRIISLLIKESDTYNDSDCRNIFSSLSYIVQNSDSSTALETVQTGILNGEVHSIKALQAALFEIKTRANIELLTTTKDLKAKSTARTQIQGDLRSDHVPYPQFISTGVVHPKARQVFTETLTTYARLNDGYHGFSSLTFDCKGLPDGTKPLLLRCAEDLADFTGIINSSDSSKFPGKGFFISGIKPERVFVSDHNAEEQNKDPFLKYKTLWPWASEAFNDLPLTSFIFTRGFIAIAAKSGDRFKLDGSDYCYVVFNDHFHNYCFDSGLLVPSKIIYDKLKGTVFNSRKTKPSQIEDINTRDLNSKGLFETATTLDLNVLNLGWGSNIGGGLCNAYLPGSKPYHEWEVKLQNHHTKDAYGHVHKSHITDNYLSEMTQTMDRLLEPLRRAHKGVYGITQKYQNLFDLFRISLSLWHKGFTAGRVVNFQEPQEEEIDLEGLDEQELEFVNDPGSEENINQPSLRMLVDAYKWNKGLLLKRVTDPNSYPVLCDAQTLRYSAKPKPRIVLDSYDLLLSIDGNKTELPKSSTGKGPFEANIWFKEVIPLVSGTKSDLRFYDRRDLELSRST